jgi:hypothetical protein
LSERAKRWKNPPQKQLIVLRFLFQKFESGNVVDDSKKEYASEQGPGSLACQQQ